MGEKRKVFKKRKDFQRAVVNTAKESIKPFYKNRRIDKQEYKKIMRDLVKKIVNTSRTYTVDKEKLLEWLKNMYQGIQRARRPVTESERRKRCLVFSMRKIMENEILQTLDRIRIQSVT